VAASNNRDLQRRSLYYCLFASHVGCLCVALLRTFYSWWIALSTQHQLRGWNNIPFFSQWTAPIACSLCEICTWHPLNILVKAPLCCDWKGRAESAQNFTMLQQATIEIPRRVHSIAACLHHTYMGVVLHVHPIHGESYIQQNANQEVFNTCIKVGRDFLKWLRLQERTKCKLRKCRYN